MRSWTTTKSAPSRAACGSAVVGERPGPAPRPQDALGEPPDDLPPLVARVEQDEIVDDHPVLDVTQAVDQFRGVRAPAADDDHLGAHAAQRNIRPCPRPPTPRRPCWPSTGAAPRPMSSSCRGSVPSSAGPGSARATINSSASKARSARCTRPSPRSWPTRGCRPPRSPICPTGVYCLAGIDLPVDEEKLAPAIDALGWTDRVILRNDTFAVSRAGTTSSWGIGVVCGTGMNCAAVGPDGRTVRFPALAELSGDFAPGGAWLGLRALGLALRAGDGRGPNHDPERAGGRAARRRPTRRPRSTGIYTGTLPYARLFELARVLLDAAADGDAPAREAADILADEIVAFVRAAVVRLDLQNEAVEVVLGGGIFDTTDTAFHSPGRCRHLRRRATRRSRPSRRPARPGCRAHRARRR